MAGTTGTVLMPRNLIPKPVYELEESNARIVKALAVMFAETRFPTTPDEFPDNTKDA